MSEQVSGVQKKIKNIDLYWRIKFFFFKFKYRSKYSLKIYIPGLLLVNLHLKIMHKYKQNKNLAVKFLEVKKKITIFEIKNITKKVMF